MPHDSNGHQIEIGDWVRVRPINQKRLVVGRVVSMHAGSQTCSGQVRWQGIGQLDQDYFDADAATIVLGAEGNLRSDPKDVVQA